MSPSLSAVNTFLRKTMKELDHLDEEDEFFDQFATRVLRYFVEAYDNRDAVTADQIKLWITQANQETREYAKRLIADREKN